VRRIVRLRVRLHCVSGLETLETQKYMRILIFPLFFVSSPGRYAPETLETQKYGRILIVPFFFAIVVPVRLRGWLLPILSISRQRCL
jgi:hypothetical protein